MEALGVETEGIVTLGEVITRVTREVQVSDDYHNAEVSGAAAAYGKMAFHIQEIINKSGPYDDVRALDEMKAWIADRIREIHSGA